MPLTGTTRPSGTGLWGTNQSVHPAVGSFFWSDWSQEYCLYMFIPFVFLHLIHFALYILCIERKCQIHSMFFGDSDLVYSSLNVRLYDLFFLHLEWFLILQGLEKQAKPPSATAVSRQNPTNFVFVWRRHSLEVKRLAPGWRAPYATWHPTRGCSSCYCSSSDVCSIKNWLDKRPCQSLVISNGWDISKSWRFKSISKPPSLHIIWMSWCLESQSSDCCSMLVTRSRRSDVMMLKTLTTTAAIQSRDCRLSLDLHLRRACHHSEDSRETRQCWQCDPSIWCAFFGGRGLQNGTVLWSNHARS